MTGREITRHSARLALVRASTLEESEMMWMPNNPYAYAARYTMTLPDYVDAVLSGRSRREILEFAAKYLSCILAGLILTTTYASIIPMMGLVAATIIIFAVGIAFMILVTLLWGWSPASW